MLHQAVPSIQLFCASFETQYISTVQNIISLCLISTESPINCCLSARKLVMQMFKMHVLKLIVTVVTLKKICKNSALFHVTKKKNPFLSMFLLFCYYKTRLTEMRAIIHLMLPLVFTLICIPPFTMDKKYCNCCVHKKLTNQHWEEKASSAGSWPLSILKNVI